MTVEVEKLVVEDAVTVDVTVDVSVLNSEEVTEEVKVDV